MDYLLFVDDDTAFLQINKTYFERLGYVVFTAVNRKEMESCLQSQPVDCIILDIMFPEKGSGGYDLCRLIRQTQTSPIIFLTSLTEKDFMYKGFDLGADDYMTKPYELKELALRIRARINRNRGIPLRRELLSYPPLTIDAGARKAILLDKQLALTAHEFDILLLLARSPQTVFSMEAIYREIWKMPDLNSAQTVRVHLARMRHKLEEVYPEHHFIQLVWGKGFMFKSPGKDGDSETNP